jgi:deoxyribonuclease V
LSARRGWPSSAAALEAEQRALAKQPVAPWRPPSPPLLCGGCFICFGPAREGREPAWAAAALLAGHRPLATRVASGGAKHPYEPGHLALREGALLEAAVRSLPQSPEVLVVNATGRDHPRRAGLALHLGAVLGLPTVGVTDRPLLAQGPGPSPGRGDRSPLRLEGEVVAHWLVTRAGARPIVVHAGWRTDPGTALLVAMACARRARTPEPLRRARRAARLARAGAFERAVT